MTRPLSVAVLVKQVPLAEDFRLGPDGRLVRDHVALEVNPYCRRAIAKGAELAAAGRCVAFTLGPPAAEEVLREAVAAGAARGVHLCDPAFAGSDTLATARALAAAIRSAAPFDLILAGLNSVDADTGQVAPELAELLGLPFASGVRQLEIEGAAARVTCERDDGTAELLVPLPAVLSVAERLCAPAKFGPAERASVPAERITRLRAVDLGPGPWGAAGSPTSVGEVRAHEHRREGRVLAGPLAAQVLEAVGLLAARGALPGPGGQAGGRAGPADDGPAGAPGPPRRREPGCRASSRCLSPGGRRWPPSCSALRPGSPRTSAARWSRSAPSRPTQPSWARAGPATRSCSPRPRGPRWPRRTSRPWSPPGPASSPPGRSSPRARRSAVR